MDAEHRPKFATPGSGGINDGEPGEWHYADEESGDGLTFKQLCALLCANDGTPYGGKTMADIARMDMDQVLNVFLRPGDPAIAARGGYWPVPNIGQNVRANRYADYGCSFDTMFWELQRWRGCPEDEIQLRWQEYLEANPTLRHSAPENPVPYMVPLPDELDTPPLPEWLRNG